LYLNGKFENGYVALPPGVLIGKAGAPLVIARTSPGVDKQNFYGIFFCSFHWVVFVCCCILFLKYI
jgi:hypothetical protein